MEKKAQDPSEIKNKITGKTICEMTWEEIRSLAGKRMTQAEVIQQMKEAARKRKSE